MGKGRVREGYRNASGAELKPAVLSQQHVADFPSIGKPWQGQKKENKQAQPQRKPGRPSQKVPSRFVSLKIPFERRSSDS